MSPPILSAETTDGRFPGGVSTPMASQMAAAMASAASSGAGVGGNGHGGIELSEMEVEQSSMTGGGGADEISPPTPAARAGVSPPTVSEGEAARAATVASVSPPLEYTAYRPPGGEQGRIRARTEEAASGTNETGSGLDETGSGTNVIGAARNAVMQNRDTSMTWANLAGHTSQYASPEEMLAGGWRNSSGAGLEDVREAY